MVISLPVSSSIKEMTSLTTKTSLKNSNSLIPAVSKASIKNLEDPSIIGGSEELSSIKTLSISKPTKAAKTCSHVCMATPFFSKHVPLWVLVTRLASALIRGSPSKSTRLKA